MKTSRKISYIVITALILIAISLLSFIKPAQAQSNNNVSDRVNEIYNNMTQKERIAQLFMVQARNWKGQGAVTKLDDDLAQIYADYKFGAFISFEVNMQETIETLNLLKDIQRAVTSKGGVPMIITTDQEGGRVQRIGTGTPMPGNMAVGATENQLNALTSGKVISEELDALGYNSTLAPDFDINSNPGNPIIATRSFSDVPEVVGNYGNEFLEGLKAKNTIGCIKHFAGHGDTDVDSHTGCPLVDKSWEELSNFELVPFKIGIEKNVEMVMSAHIIYPQVDNSTITAQKGKHKGQEVGTPATLSKILITDKLKGEMGFNGVVCTDSMGMAGVSSILETDDRDARALNAGVDMLCMPLTDDEELDPETFRANADKIIQAIDDKVSDERIEDACKRILTLKEKKGILDYDESKYTETRALETVGNAEFRQEERDMAADGVTLVKNTDNTFPLHLNSDSKVLMLVQDHMEGYSEKYAAQFILGWNRAKAAGLIPEGAQVNVVMFDKNDWDNAEKIAAIDNADIIFTNSIVRNKDNMAYKKWQTAAPKKYTDYAKEHGKRSMVVSIDAPYDVQMYPNADGIIAIYNLIGSKENWEDVLASGATTSKYAMGANLVAAIEVAFGTYGAYGKLPVNIYEFDAATDAYNLNKIVYNRGFGIEYDPITNMDKVDVNLEFGEATYTGKPICPKVIATVESRHSNGSKTLTEGKDYTIEYKDNVEIGTASVQVNGMGSYLGSKTANFQIVEKSDTPVNPSEDSATNPSQTGDSPYLLFALATLAVASLLTLTVGRKIRS